MILRVKDADGNVQEIVTIRGPQGEKGADGTVRFEDLTEGQIELLRGFNGVTFEPSLDEYGNLSWRNDGGLPNPATVNITGPQGPRGTILVRRATLNPYRWNYDGTLFYQVVYVEGVTGDADQFITYDVELTGEDVDADTAALEAWAPADGSGPYSHYVAAVINGLVFHASTAPTVYIPVIVGVD